jgi:ferredoxin
VQAAPFRLLPRKRRGLRTDLQGEEEAMKLEMKVDYSSGETGEFLRVDEDKCTGCGRRSTFCVRDVWVK